MSLESFIDKVFNEDSLVSMRLLPDESVDLVVADPPYNLGKDYGNDSDKQESEEFLRWTEDERAERTHLAPLLLVPITLNRQSVRTGYSIKRHDDETIINPTLMQLLRENFQMTFKGLDPLPADDSGIDVAKVWQILRLAVKEIPRWEVIEDV